MGTQTNRHERLLRTIALGRGTHTIDTLAQSIGVSGKTIRRDLAALRQVGIQVQEQLDHHGRKSYWLSRESLPDVAFTYDEAMALMVCRVDSDQFDGTLIGEAARSAFEKIRMALSPRQHEFFDRIAGSVHRSPTYANYSGQADTLEAITLGIEDSKATFIAYRSARSTEPVTYDIHPYAMCEHHGAMYIVGFSCHHDEIRTWKLDRMLNAEVTEFPFVRPKGFDLKKHFEGAVAVIAGPERITVRVRFKGTAARYAAERQIEKTQVATPGPGGTLEMTYTLTSTIEIKSYVLSFGSSAEVLQPQSLRDEVAQELRHAAAMYNSPQPTPPVPTDQ